MFEILTGDCFEVEGQVLSVYKLRLGVVGDRVTTFVHFSHGNELKLREAEDFCAWLADGLDSGVITNLNRAADFGA